MNNYLRWSLSFCLVLLLCIISYTVADIQTALWFNEQKGGLAYRIFSFITLFGESQWYLIPGILLFIVLRNNKPLIALRGLYLFTSVAVSGIAADIIKFLTGRARPKLWFSDQLYLFDFFHTEAEWTSFPSGHSATAFSAAIVLATYYPRWKIAFFCAAILIAFSRILLTKHYISDVIAGSFLGIASTVLIYNQYFKARLNAVEYPQI
ncbi:MAG: phosphatase PAP2 family protein [Chlorobiaceae bacterium]|nr:phosphatase PAP2 family protein [Chlorobiaceae bacterium]